MAADIIATAACGGIGIGKGMSGIRCYIIDAVTMKHRICNRSTISGCAIMARATAIAVAAVTVGFGISICIGGWSAMAGGAA